MTCLVLSTPRASHSAFCGPVARTSSMQDPAAPRTQVKVEISLPEGAVAGDKLTFCSTTGSGGQVTTFSAVVPASKDGGVMKKISVTVPVPANFPPNQTLQISKLTLNGVPVTAPRPTPEQTAAQQAVQEQRTRLEAHFNRMAPSERCEMQIPVDTTPLRPAKAANVLQPLGFWRVPCRRYHLPAVSAWEGGKPHEVSQQRLVFLGSQWVVAVEMRRAPWKCYPAGKRATPGADAPETPPMTDGCDCELVAKLQRVPPVLGDTVLPPITIFAQVEFADRFSGWQRVSLSSGESHILDLGDRRSHHPLDLCAATPRATLCSLPSPRPALQSTLRALRRTGSLGKSASARSSSQSSRST